MAQIKGFAIRGLLKFSKNAGLAGGIPAMIAALPADVAPHFKSQIVSSGWYPYRAFSELLRAIDRTLGRGDLGMMFDLGLRSGKEDSGTVFKIIATIASVETIIKRSPIFWQKYCDTGRIEVLKVEKGYMRVALKEFPDIDEAQCTLITGWIQGMAEATGAKGIQLKQVRCVHRKDPWCEYEGTWK